MKSLLPVKNAWRGKAPLVHILVFLVLLCCCFRSFSQVQLIKEFQKKQSIHADNSTSCSCGPYVYFSIVFNVGNGRQFELWRTDGTEAGTIKLDTLDSSSRFYFFCFQNKFVFVKNGALYISDGTIESTVQVRVFERIVSVKIFQDKLILANHNESTETFELWSIRNAELPPLLLTQQTGCKSVGQLTVHKDNIKIFIGLDLSYELWETTGVEADTRRLFTSTYDSYREVGWTVGVSADFIYFRQFKTYGNFWDAPLYRTDGTLGGTEKVLDYPHLFLNVWPDNKLTVFNSGVLVFDAVSGDTLVWVQEQLPEEHTAFYYAREQLLFNMDNNIYVSDGTQAGTQIVKEGMILNLAFHNGERKFYGLSLHEFNTRTLHFFQTDGTSAGTISFPIDTMQSQSPTFFMASANAFFLTMETSETGKEPAFSDGTQDGTRSLGDLTPGSGSSTILSVESLHELLVFTQKPTEGGGPLTIWVTDGTSDGTKPLAQPTLTFDVPAADPKLMKAGERLLFFADVCEESCPALWSTDGTTVGTQELVQNISDGYVGSTDQNAFFLVRDSLLKTDGNEVARLAHLPDYSVHHSNYTAVEEDLIFSLTSFLNGHHRTEVWLADGSSGETQMLVGSTHAKGLTPVQFATLENGLTVFSLSDNANGNELWVTDGSKENTRLLSDLHPGKNSGSPSDFEVHGNYVYFIAETKTFNGSGLWRTDGTAEGTMLVADMGESGSIRPKNLFSITNGIFFWSYFHNRGWTLWRSDGTASGTKPFMDGLFTVNSGDPITMRGDDNNFTFIMQMGQEFVLIYSNGTSEGSRWFTLNDVDLTSTGNLMPLFFIDDNTFYRTGSGLYKFSGYDGNSEEIMAIEENSSLALTLYGNSLYFIADRGLYKIPETMITNESKNQARLPFEIYPNPVTDKFQISSKYFEDMQVEVINVVGKAFNRVSLKKESTSDYIDVGNLPPGVYLIRIQTSQGTFTSRIVRKD